MEAQALVKQNIKHALDDIERSMEGEFLVDGELVNLTNKELRKKIKQGCLVEEVVRNKHRLLLHAHFPLCRDVLSTFNLGEVEEMAHHFLCFVGHGVVSNGHWGDGEFCILLDRSSPRCGAREVELMIVFRLDVEGEENKQLVEEFMKEYPQYKEYIYDSEYYQPSTGFVSVDGQTSYKGYKGFPLAYVVMDGGKRLVQEPKAADEGLLLTSDDIFFDYSNGKHYWHPLKSTYMDSHLSVLSDWPITRAAAPTCYGPYDVTTRGERKIIDSHYKGTIKTSNLMPIIVRFVEGTSAERMMSIAKSVMFALKKHPDFSAPKKNIRLDTNPHFPHDVEIHACLEAREQGKLMIQLNRRFRDIDVDWYVEEVKFNEMQDEHKDELLKGKIPQIHACLSEDKFREFYLRMEDEKYALEHQDDDC